jgi:hypothetical protein
MAAIHRRSQRAPVSRLFTLATADDLNGTSDNTQAYDISGAGRLLLIQDNAGAAGTAGIDVLEISYDGGENWEAVDDLLPIDADDKSGTVQASGALNAAGVEPTRYAVFKAGPYSGKVAIRISRGAAGTGTAWVTGAPAVYGFLVGGNTGGQLTALA